MHSAIFCDLASWDQHLTVLREQLLEHNPGLHIDAAANHELWVQSGRSTGCISLKNLDRSHGRGTWGPRFFGTSGVPALGDIPAMEGIIDDSKSVLGALRFAEVYFQNQAILTVQWSSWDRLWAFRGA